METKQKNLLIGGLIAVVLIMAVGYAAFATQLNIEGTASTTSTWDIHIKSITPGTPIGTAENKSATVSDDKLSATFETELIAPADSLTYTVVVENSGTLPAKLSAIKFEQSQTNSNESAEGTDNTKAITYDYHGIAQNDTLAVNGTATFTVTVTYNPAITSQPDDADLTSTLNMQLSYVQDTVSGE